MGQLVDGVWEYGTLGANGGDGDFRRQNAVFRNWVTPDGSPGPSGTGGFAAESGRYHLYVSYACPWASRALIYRELKGLAPHIGVSVVHPVMGRDGWTFDDDFPGATGDPVNGTGHLRDLYLIADPRMTGKVTVPVLWDTRTRSIVSNESSEIIRMFDTAFDAVTGRTGSYRPAELRPEIDALNERVYDTVNNGVYKAGFAVTQAAYDRAIGPLFETLDWLEQRLATRRYLTGDTVTEADWRLFATAVRFDTVYHTHFKCNRRLLREYPNLWGWTRELYQMPGIAPTVRQDHITHHYYRSHPDVNPHGVIPINPVIDWDEPHGRG